MSVSSIRTARAWVGGSAAAATAAALLVGSPAQAVQGPETASHAYTARIVVGGIDAACTGTLVDPRWVLTTSACFADATGAVTPGAPKRPTTVTVGRPDLTDTSKGAVRAAVQLVPHPARDVVMVKLATRVTTVKPVAVAGTAAADGESVRVTGYGRTRTEWVPDRLHTGAFTSSAADRPAALRLAAAGDAVVCQGDAGGPVLRENGGTPELLAVVGRSWQGGCLGSPAAETRTDAFATRVDDLRPWISATAFAAQGDLTGDKVADLAAVWGDGSLHAYPGNGTGGLTGTRLAQPGGTTWSTVKHLTKGDFTGDGIADVMAVWGDGTLHVYTGKGDGTLNTQVPVPLGGNTWRTIRHLTAGDFTGDGIADLMAIWGDGTLHLYPGKGNGQVDDGRAVPVGGSTWITVTQLTAGDFTGDGIADLMAVWGDGTLHVYTGKGDGTVNTHVPVTLGGDTWRAIKHLTAGDYNRDGLADLVAIWGDGTLHGYPGKGGGQLGNGSTIPVGGSTWSPIAHLA
jgi:hypothetical protein